MLGRITEHAGDVLWAQLKLMYLLNDLQSQQMTRLVVASIYRRAAILGSCQVRAGGHGELLQLRQ